MGKVRKPRPNKNKKPKPIPVDNSGEEEPMPVDAKENVIQTILDQLQGADVEEKYCGLQTFALLIENAESIDEVINRGIVRVAAPLLLDPAVAVRNAAAGSLRNFSTVKFEVCDTMMEQDVMTPLVAFFHEYAESWTPDPNSKTKEEDNDTMVQCINLLLNLCESSELAIKYLGQSRILDILQRYLDLTFAVDIITAALQCLLVVVEDNPNAMERIKTNSERQLQALLSIEGNSPSDLLVKSLAAGVTINICGGNMAALPSNVIHQIISILADTLSVDHRVMCNQLSSNVPLKDGFGKLEAPKGKAANELEKQIKSVTQMLEAQQSTIEIFTNLCSCEDGEENDDGDSSDSEEMIEDELSCTNGETSYSEEKLPPVVMEALISLKIFDKVWSKTQLPAENVLLILKEYEGSISIHKKLLNLQSGSLLCINNMLSTLPIENLGGVQGVYKMWVDAGKLVFKQSSENLTLMESATAVMRAALDKIKMRNGSGNHNLFNEIAKSDIEIMLNGIRECQVPEIRSNLIRMIGLLALLLVNNLNETTSNVICTITEFILEQAYKENEVWVLAEAIDTVVDLYSEDETDGLAARLKLQYQLAVLEPILKNKARQQKRLPKKYKVLVSTVCSNLPRFINYLKGRLINL